MNLRLSLLLLVSLFSMTSMAQILSCNGPAKKIVGQEVCLNMNKVKSAVLSQTFIDGTLGYFGINDLEMPLPLTVYSGFNGDSYTGDVTLNDGVICNFNFTYFNLDQNKLGFSFYGFGVDDNLSSQQAQNCISLAMDQVINHFGEYYCVDAVVDAQGCSELEGLLSNDIQSSLRGKVDVSGPIKSTNKMSIPAELRIQILEQKLQKLTK